MPVDAQLEMLQMRTVADRNAFFKKLDEQVLRSLRSLISARHNAGSRSVRGWHRVLRTIDRERTGKK